MARRAASNRLRKEFLRLVKEPVENIKAAPLESNILEWHYAISGPKGTPYEGGVYHGKLLFPQEYPFKPPSILMLTPNGRFKTNMRLCLSMSDYHPETWNPLWSVSSILSGLLSFMLEKAPTLGSMESSDSDKRRFARASLGYNVAKSAVFNDLFPDFRTMLLDRAKASREQKEAAEENGTAHAGGGGEADAELGGGGGNGLRQRAGQGKDGAGGEASQAGKQGAGADADTAKEDVTDKMVAALILVTVVFLISMLYT